MGADTTSLSTLIRPVVSEQPSVAMYTNNSFLPAMQALGMKEADQLGDNYVRWKVLRGTGNSSVETFTEGMGIASAGSQSWVEAYLAWVYTRAHVQMSGHARDAMRSAYLGDAYLGQFAGEVKYAVDNMMDNYTNALLGTGANGVQLAIDSAGTYAGINRSTYSDWGSGETAVSGVLTVAAMTAAVEALRDNDIANTGTRFDAVVMPVNQITNYAALVGPENGTAANRLVRYVAQPGQVAPHIDLGWDDTGLTFMGKPIVGVPDLTDTVVLFLCNIPDDWFLTYTRRLETKELAITDDSAANLQVSFGAAFGCRNTRRQYKLTGVTA